LIIGCFSIYNQSIFNRLGEEPGLYGKELRVSRPPQGTAETDSLAASLRELHEKCERRKKEIRGLLEETGALMKKALVFLKKANCPTRRLTARQRKEAGIFYPPSFFDSRIKGKNRLPAIPDRILNPEVLPELTEAGGSRRLVPEELKMLRLIDALKKNLLALDLLEMRCRELLLSIDKALEAFKHEYASIRRRLYPYWVLSVLCKHVNRLRGFSYFSPRDLKELAVLGELTGDVLKIADSPIL
jgi:hypothetical protein